jgi:coenzyme PQQ precursor peptide PqqA
LLQFSIVSKEANLTQYLRTHRRQARRPFADRLAIALSGVNRLPKLTRGHSAGPLPFSPTVIVAGSPYKSFTPRRGERAMTWATPKIVEVCVGMEVTSYESAEI